MSALIETSIRHIAAYSILCVRLPLPLRTTQAHVQLQAGWSQGPQRQCLHFAILFLVPTGVHIQAAHEAQQVEPAESLRPRL